MNDENNEHGLKPKPIDYVASAASAVLGEIPFVGSLLVEVAGTVIPNQRMDRIVKFAEKLQDRISNLEEDFVRSQLMNENFTDLIEEGIRQAARSLSEERRDYIASIISNSLSQDKISVIESKHLMMLLNALNDIEIIWLRYYLVPTHSGDEEFRSLHKLVLSPVMVHLNDPAFMADQAAIQRDYVHHLSRLNLLNPKYETSREDKGPVFDDFTGSQKISGYEITRLGKLLLRFIGFEKDIWLE